MFSLSLTHTASQSHIFKPEEVTNGDAIGFPNTGQRSVLRTVKMNEGNKDTREESRGGEAGAKPDKVYQSGQNSLAASQSASSTSTGHFLFRLIYTLTCYMSNHRCENPVNYQHNHKHNTVCNKSIDLTFQTQVFKVCIKQWIISWVLVNTNQNCFTSGEKHLFFIIICSNVLKIGI